MTQKYTETLKKRKPSLAIRRTKMYLCKNISNYYLG